MCTMLAAVRVDLVVVGRIPWRTVPILSSPCFACRLADGFQ